MKTLLIFLAIASVHASDRTKDQKIPITKEIGKEINKEINKEISKPITKPIDGEPVNKIDRSAQVITIKPHISIVNLCGQKFSQIDWSSGDKNFMVETESVKINDQDYMVPSFVRSGIDLKKPVTIQIEKQIILPAPLLPSLPILPTDGRQKLCDYIKKIKPTSAREIQTFNTNKFNGSIQNNILKIELKETTIPADNNSVQAPQIIPGKMVIYYDDLYAQEVGQMANLLNSKGIKISLQPLSTLPGLNDGILPKDCRGQYMDECFYSLSPEAAKYISEDYVPNLLGFQQKPKLAVKGKRFPYIPGLIRADLRRRIVSEQIKYAMLIGSPKKLAPIYVSREHHDLGRNYQPGTYIHTDVYFMIPNGPLKLKPQLSFGVDVNQLWSCKDLTDSKIRLRKWCSNNEVRHWPDPALSAYRDAIYTPESILFDFDNFTASFAQGIDFDKMLAVGRIPTREDLSGTKDPIVKDYTKKLEMWFENIPTINDNSIATYGGTTNDAWIFDENDSVGFRLAYGQNSKIYASEFFVPLPKCPGCEYKSGEAILPEIAKKSRRVAWLLNGHGAMDGIQAPYANGNISSEFRAENRYRVGGDHIRPTLFSYPAYNTIKVLENSKTIIGHVIANSCSTANFTLAGRGDIEHLFTKKFNGNQRSLAEQFIALPEAGAMNAIMNADVGYGGSDNTFNRYFMAAITQTRKKCSNTVGDAFKLGIYNLSKNTTLSFQIHNRQFLGAPIVPIAQPEASCISKTVAK